MKYFLFPLILLIHSKVQSQDRTSTVNLGNNVTITGVIRAFNPSKHKLDTCKDENNYQFLCKIDKQEWFGSDIGLHLPESQLVSLKIKIDNRQVPLDVSKMYNPTFGDNLSKEQFKLKKIPGGYKLFSFFSDGAGTYTAHWEIKNYKAKRVLISTDESNFSWQSED